MTAISQESNNNGEIIVPMSAAKNTNVEVILTGSNIFFHCFFGPQRKNVLLLVIIMLIFYDAIKLIFAQVYIIMNVDEPVTAPIIVANDIEYRNTLSIIEMQNPIILVFKSKSGQQLSFANLVSAIFFIPSPKKSSILMNLY